MNNEKIELSIELVGEIERIILCVLNNQRIERAFDTWHRLGQEIQLSRHSGPKVPPPPRNARDVGTLKKGAKVKKAGKKSSKIKPITT